MRTLDRFEGTYGALYNAVLTRPLLRRAVFRVVGNAEPILQLDHHVAELVAHASAGVLLDVPCGGGTILPILQSAGFAGRAIELDLAAAMVARARERADGVSGFDVEIVQADATAMPLDDASVDLAVSINGLHVMPDPGAVLAEIARVLTPDGHALIVTIVATAAPRNRLLRAGGRAASVLPVDPPTRTRMRELIGAAGFQVEQDLGGDSFAGFSVVTGSA